ncbi:MAG: phosphatase PAP2 family protein [Gemmatimonadaceae bacterium]
MRIRWCTVAAASLTLSSDVSAQSVGNMLKDDFKNAGSDILAIWTSPFDASGRDWGLVVASLGAFGVSMLADQSVSDWAIRNDTGAFFRALKPVRRGGYLFSGKYVVPPVAALYVIGIATKNQDLRDFVMGCMASWGGESPPRRAIAHLIGRARPDTTDGVGVAPNDPHIWELGGGGEWVMRSFPGGHFANVMGCATFWNKRFRLGAAEPVLYALATAVGVGRMGDKAHWFSDTVMGGILGYAVGSEVARRSLARQSRRVGGGGGAAFEMSPARGGVVLNLRWTF